MTGRESVEGSTQWYCIFYEDVYNVVASFSLICLPFTKPLHLRALPYIFLTPSLDFIIAYLQDVHPNFSAEARHTS